MPLAINHAIENFETVCNPGYRPVMPIQQAVTA